MHSVHRTSYPLTADIACVSLLFSEHGTSVLKLRRTQSGLKPHTPTEPPHKHQYHPRLQAQIAFPLACCSAVSAPMGKSSETFSRPSAARISSTPQAWISSGCSAAGYRSLWCTAQISRVHWGKQKAHAPRKGENRLRLCEKTHSARSVKSENAPPARCVRNGKPRRTFVLRGLFTLAAIYSRGTCRPTTIDVLMFHFRVRNGSGWGHQAMTTRLLSYSLPRSSLLRNS